MNGAVSLRQSGVIRLSFEPTGISFPHPMKPYTRLLSAAGFAAALASSVFAAVETYTIDPVHSSVGFSIRHFVSKVPGKFDTFSGRITVDRDDLTKSSTEATIEVASIDTGNRKRDDDLRSPNFFDAAKHRQITFKSKSWKNTGENTFDVVGDLTIKDVTKEVVLHVTSLGFAPGMGGTQLSGWEATTKIDKRDYNVKSPKILEAALGNEVTITINIEAGIKKP